MSNLQKKRKSDCSVPDVADILKKFESKKRKVKGNKNLLKIKPITTNKSNLKSDGQSKNVFIEANETDISSPLIIKNCSQTVSKTNQQDKKVWQPPIKQYMKTSSKADTTYSDKIKKECNDDYTMHKEKSIESIDTCELECNESHFMRVIEGSSRTRTSIKTNGQIDENVSQTPFCDTELEALNENETCSKDTSAILQHMMVKHHHIGDDSLNNRNSLHIGSELTAPIPMPCTQYVYGDAACYKQNPLLENQIYNSSDIETTCTEIIELNEKSHLNEFSGNDTDTPEKIHGHLCGDSENTEDGGHSSKENTLIITSPTSPDNAQSSKHYPFEQVEEKCLNITLDTNCEPNRAGNDIKYEEYDDEEITITHSQLNHIENEFSKTKISSVLTGMQTYSDSIKQSLPPEFYASPSSLKVLWNKKVEEDGMKLRQLVQELRKINDLLLNVRNEIWPSRNHFSFLPNTK